MSQVAHALLTRPPLGSAPKRFPSLDLHVLSTPPAFILSQDQTLIFLVRPVRTLLSDFFSFFLTFFLLFIFLDELTWVWFLHNYSVLKDRHVAVLSDNVIHYILLSRFCQEVFSSFFLSFLFSFSLTGQLVYTTIFLLFCQAVFLKKSSK